jgi:hypothetical protein
MLYFNFGAGTPEETGIFQRWLSVWYVVALLAALAYFYLVVRWRLTPDDIAHFQRVD